jgi:hypothetical protein
MNLSNTVGKRQAHHAKYNQTCCIRTVKWYFYLPLATLAVEFSRAVARPDRFAKLRAPVLYAPEANPRNRPFVLPSMRSFARHELAERKTEFDAQGLELEGVLLGWGTAPGVVSSASSALAARLR